jgi:thiol-disulfide isomerase/thioredoxin
VIDFTVFLLISFCERQGLYPRIRLSGGQYQLPLKELHRYPPVAYACVISLKSALKITIEGVPSQLMLDNVVLLIQKKALMKTFFLAAAAIIMISCSAQPADKTSQEGSTTSSTSSAPITRQDNWPKPNSYVGGIPVYDKFSDIAPLFEMDNDTTYVINFWATWCKPCVEELPYFEALTEAHQADKIQVVLISLDFPKQLESKLVPFVQKHQLQSKVVTLLDGKYNDWIDRVSTDWTGAIPATLFRKGEKEHFLGHSVESTDELEDILKTIL